ncbi:zinc finger protein 354C-like [Betta splendens]|uniref:Zinc finger protein 354C-like n=1 Tax=Betta splendens TaxID=158456 RepID=A0A6P7L0E6_BETSP|nr:zinc finger protein 354C-like [Betta splendens]
MPNQNWTSHRPPHSQKKKGERSMAVSWSHRKCTVLGCSNPSKSLFTLPKDQHLRTLWLDFIYDGAAPATTPVYLYVCALHFTPDCFKNEGAFTAGFVSRLLLKKGVVPTVRHPLAADQYDEKSLRLSKRQDAACQTEMPVRSVGTQLSRRTLDPHVRSKSTQTTVLTREIGVGPSRPSRQASQESTTINGSSKRQRLDSEEDDTPLEGSDSELAANTYKQVNGSVLAALAKHLTEETNLVAEAASTNHNHGIVTDESESFEESDDMDEIDDSVEDDMDSDKDWDLMDAAELDDEYSEKGSDYSDLMRNHLCQDCGVFFRKTSQHTCQYKIKPYSCNLCGKRCVNEIALNSHNRIHSEGYEHRCKYCNVTFKSKRDKIIHEKIHVNDEKPYKCSDCSETFSTLKGRRTHQKKHIPHILTCDICGTEFFDNSALQRHILVHTGEKPYKCSVCQQSFTQSNHLTSHMRLHTGERPYKCQHCDKCFNHNVSLKSHIQRYHSSKSGHEQEKPDQGAGYSCDTLEDEDRRATDSEPDNGDEELDTEEEEEEEVVVVRKMYKRRKRGTGRPKGRPKNCASGNVVLTVQTEGTGTDSENKKLQIQKTKNKQRSNEENEDELSDGHQSSISAQEEENSATPANCLHSDSESGPEDTQKRATPTAVNSEGMSEKKLF